MSGKLKKRIKTPEHIRRDPVVHLQGYRDAACAVESERVTLDVNKVTCVHCKHTMYFDLKCDIQLGRDKSDRASKRRRERVQNEQD